MTELLKRAIAEVEKLSADQQDAIAARMITHAKDELGKKSNQQPTSLKGSVLRYDDPTEPVGMDDWETLR